MPARPIAPSVTSTGNSVGSMAASAQDSERRNTATITATTSAAEAKLESCVRCTSSTICTNTFTGPLISVPKPRR